MNSMVKNGPKWSPIIPNAQIFVNVPRYSQILQNATKCYKIIPNDPKKVNWKIEDVKLKINHGQNFFWIQMVSNGPKYSELNGKWSKINRDHQISP